MIITNNTTLSDTIAISSGVIKNNSNSTTFNPLNNVTTISAISGGVITNSTSTTFNPLPGKVVYHVLGENIEVNGFVDANLMMIISTLNILKKPYYNELKKNNCNFPKEIEDYLKVAFRDDLIDSIINK